MGLVYVFVEHLLRLIIYSFKSVVHSVNVAGTGRWSCTEATVTTEPTVARGFGCPTVEVAYSYRVDGELYTGIYEQPFLLADSVSECVERFSNGRKFVVRVKTNEPEVSVMREKDQRMQLARS